MRRGAQLVSDMFAGKADGVEFLCKGIQIGLEIFGFNTCQHDRLLEIVVQHASSFRRRLSIRPPWRTAIYYADRRRFDSFSEALYLLMEKLEQSAALRIFLSSAYHLCSRKMTHTENTIWRALCDIIIHAEGVPSKKINEFRLITHRLRNLAALGARPTVAP